MRRKALLIRVIEKKTITTERVYRVLEQPIPEDKRYRNGLCDRAEKKAMAGKGEILKETVKEEIETCVPLMDIGFKPTVCLDRKKVRKLMGITAGP